MNRLAPFRVVSILVVLVMGTPAVSWAGLTVQTGSEPRSVQVVSSNPGDDACGLELKFGDGRTERRRMESKENWQIQHAYAADGDFVISVAGVPLMRGLRSVGACDLAAQSNVRISATQVLLPGVARGAQAEGSASPSAAPAAPPAAPNPAQRPQPVADGRADLILYARNNSDVFRFVTGIDGSKRLDSADLLLSRGYNMCYVLFPDAYNGLGASEGQAILSAEVTRTINALVNNRAVRHKSVECIHSGKFFSRLPIDVLVVQRQAVRLLTSQPELAQFQPFAEVKYETLSQNANRRQQLAARRAQDLATWTQEIEQLAPTDSTEKVGSLSLAMLSDEGGPLRACTLEYTGPQAQAVRGYAEQLLSYTSPSFRNKAQELRATYNTNQPFANVYKTIDAFYTAYQRDQNTCHVLITYPKNLKLVMTAIERDRKSRAFEVNDLIATNAARDTWARKQGFADLAASQFASEIQGNASTLNTLASKGIADKASYDATLAEMKASRYSDTSSVAEVLAYLEDKAAAADKKGTTATTIRREREARAEQQARAEREKREQEERIRNLPLTKAGLDPKISYKYYRDGSCRDSAGERCLNINQYKQICGWAEGLTRNIRPMAAVMYNGNYAQFLREGGTMADISYRWSDAGNQCRVSFAITGMFNGTSHRKEFSGYASNFIINSSKEVLIHYVSGM
jgi:hypothetical protein